MIPPHIECVKEGCAYLPVNLVRNRLTGLIRNVLFLIVTDILLAAARKIPRPRLAVARACATSLRLG